MEHKVQRHHLSQGDLEGDDRQQDEQATHDHHASKQMPRLHAFRRVQAVAAIGFLFHFPLIAVAHADLIATSIHIVGIGEEHFAASASVVMNGAEECGMMQAAISNAVDDAPNKRIVTTALQRWDDVPFLDLIWHHRERHGPNSVRENGEKLVCRWEVLRDFITKARSSLKSLYAVCCNVSINVEPYGGLATNICKIENKVLFVDNLNSRRGNPRSLTLLNEIGLSPGLTVSKGSKYGGPSSEQNGKTSQKILTAPIKLFCCAMLSLIGMFVLFISIARGASWITYIGFFAFCSGIFLWFSIPPIY